MFLPPEPGIDETVFATWRFANAKTQRREEEASVFCRVRRQPGKQGFVTGVLFSRANLSPMTEVPGSVDWGDYVSGVKSFASSGGTATVPVSAAGTCHWTAVSNAAWIAIGSPGSGQGNGSFNYSVAKNTGARRTGTITVAGRTYTVTQTRK